MGRARHLADRQLHRVRHESSRQVNGGWALRHCRCAQQPAAGCGSGAIGEVAGHPQLQQQAQLQLSCAAHGGGLRRLQRRREHLDGRLGHSREGGQGITSHRSYCRLYDGRL